MLRNAVIPVLSDRCRPLLLALLCACPAIASARFWVAEAEAARRVEAQLDSLRTTLRQQGIEVDSLLCRQGHPPSGNDRIERRLIDLRT